MVPLAPNSIFQMEQSRLRASLDLQTWEMSGRKPLRDGKETPENLAEAVTPLSLSGLHFLFQAEQPRFVRKKAEGRGWDLRTGHCGGGQSCPRLFLSQLLGPGACSKVLDNMKGVGCSHYLPQFTLLGHRMGAGGVCPSVGLS